jgi:hypothetical protein
MMSPGNIAGMKLWNRWEIGTADRTARHFNDCIARIFDFGISDCVAADIFLAVPNESAHGEAQSNAVIQKRRRAQSIAALH